MKKRARTERRAEERKVQRDIRALAELGLKPHQVYALAAPEYQPSTKGDSIKR